MNQQSGSLAVSFPHNKVKQSQSLPAAALGLKTDGRLSPAGTISVYCTASVKAPKNRFCQFF